MAKNVFCEVTVNFCPSNSTQLISVQVDICVKIWRKFVSDNLNISTDGSEWQLCFNRRQTSVCEVTECRQAETESPVSLHYTSRSDEPAGLDHIMFLWYRRIEGWYQRADARRTKSLLKRRWKPSQRKTPCCLQHSVITHCKCQADVQIINVDLCWCQTLITSHQSQLGFSITSSIHSL